MKNVSTFDKIKNNNSYSLFQVAFVLSLVSALDAWETPSPHQYHIQTDEGPERYFRYQTDSGQFRKEKRLEDGTIIGTYAWIDADGILRQNDYISDKAGYRILKAKNVYVGRNINVGDAVKAAKKYPASAGTLVKSNQRPVNSVPYNAAPPTAPTSYVQSTTPPSVFSTTTTKPYVGIAQNSFVSSTPIYGIPSTSTEVPIVEITPHSYISSTPNPALLIQPVTNISSDGTYTPSTVSATPSYYKSPPSSVQYIPKVPSSTASSVQYVPTVPPEGYLSTPKPNYDQIYSAEIDQNSLDYNNPYVHQRRQGYRFQNGPTYPLDQNGRPYSGNEYDGQRSSYDGVSVTNDGFRYYIPRAYHEEQTLPDDTRSGSFGYIDPFGIRRVIYYNAAPGTGFQHRKNNRYVGFQATPYDPRPPY